MYVAYLEAGFGVVALADAAEVVLGVGSKWWAFVQARSLASRSIRNTSTVSQLCRVRRAWWCGGACVWCDAHRSAEETGKTMQAPQLQDGVLRQTEAESASA